MKRIPIFMKVMVILLVLVFVLTSCDTATTTTQGTTTAAGETTQATTATVGEEPVLELTGLMIQYATPPDPNNDLWKHIEKTFNVKYDIEWVPDADYTNKLNLVLGSGSIPDIVYSVTVADPTINQAIKGGYFADLTPVLGDFSEYPNLGNLIPDCWITSKVDGKNYMFPRSRGNYDMPIAHIRGDWLEKLDMELPKTFDEFTAYLKGVCSADLDGNGQVDTIGITGISYDIWSEAFGPGNARLVRPEGKDTGIVNVRLTEAYAMLLEYLQGLYKDGLISSEYAMLKGQNQEDLFLAGKSAMYVKNIWHKKRMDNELQKIDPNASSTLIYYLNGPNGTAFNYDKGWAGGLLVSAKVGDEKLKRIVKMMDESAKPENFNLISFGIEGEHYTMVDDFPKLTEKGETTISQAWPYPFTYATLTYAKVDSPLADAAYNLATRKMTDDTLKPIYASYVNPLPLGGVLQSDAWVAFWSQNKDQFEAFVAEVVSGQKTVDEFRSYQKELLKNQQIIDSYDQFQTSYDGFGLPKQ